MQGKLPTRASEADGERGGPLFPKLVARRNASAQAVAQHQRERLHAAMIESCARHGYASTSVRELIRLAGVSPNTVYKQFDGKEDCFLSTFDLVVADAVGRISAAQAAVPPGGDRDWTAGLCRSFDAFVDELLLRPKASHLAVVEVLAVGASALERIERAEAAFVAVIATGLARAPEPRPLPPLITRALVGGIWFVTRCRLLEDQPLTLAAGGRELRDWVLAYPGLEAERLKFVAPRTRVRPGKSSFQRSSSEPRARMLRAAAELAVARGYAALSEVGIAERAGVEPAELAAEFGSAGDCFFASLEMLTARALAAALRDSEGAWDWADAMCSAIESILRRLAEDQVFARAAFVASNEAGAVGSEHCETLIAAFAGAFVRRAPESRRPSALVAEATIGAAWSVIHRYVNCGRGERLEVLAVPISYLALAPVVGAEEAIRCLEQRYI